MSKYAQSRAQTRKRKHTSNDDNSNKKCKKSAASLGIIRLDYNYPPAPADIDCLDTVDYDVYYKVVPGLTFEMCQKGKITDEVEKRFKDSIKWLEKKKVSGITGDCSFMMYFQKIA